MTAGWDFHESFVAVILLIRDGYDGKVTAPRCTNRRAKTRDTPASNSKNPARLGAGGVLYLVGAARIELATPPV